MPLDMVSVSGLAVITGLGMRHALDADHVATVDGMTFAVLDANPRLAAWVGAIFALGHGFVVTAIAVLACLLGESAFGIPTGVVAWLPVVLLVAVGALNVRALVGPADYQPTSAKALLLPRKLRGGSHPVAILATGMAFALMLDSVATAIAFGSAAAGAGVAGALAVGTAFTVGMTVVATIYGWVMCRALVVSANAQRLRRGIGWFTVLLAFGVAGALTFENLGGELPGVAESSLAAVALGLVVVAVAVVLWRRGSVAEPPAPMATRPAVRPRIRFRKRLAGSPRRYGRGLGAIKA